jgi:hypothetical protein
MIAQNAHSTDSTYCTVQTNYFTYKIQYGHQIRLFRCRREVFEVKFCLCFYSFYPQWLVAGKNPSARPTGNKKRKTIFFVNNFSSISLVDFHFLQKVPFYCSTLIIQSLERLYEGHLHHLLKHRDMFRPRVASTLAKSYCNSLCFCYSELLQM